MMNRKPCTVKVEGEYACFARPDFKSERVTYPVMTPSAARGALEAIFWKPEVRWEVTEIDVLRPIKEMSVLRNELGSKQSPRSSGAVIETDRQQRTSRILRDVGYLIHADLCLQEHAHEPLAKYLDQFERRIKRGQCFQTPYLGNREFAARFQPATEEDLPLESLDLDVGSMIFDQAFIPDADSRRLAFHRHGPSGATMVHGRTQAIFFDAQVRRGRLLVPAELHAQKRALEGGTDAR